MIQTKLAKPVIREDTSTLGKQRPIKSIRSCGVKASVWENKVDNAVFYSVSIERSYKNKQDQWQTTSSLRVNDLPKAILVLNKCYEFLVIGNENTAD